MRIESSVTSASWIPSAAITGLPRVFFEHRVTHYDPPPPQEWTDLHSVLGSEGARFANHLRAWIEVHDGNITAFGQDGGPHLNSTLVRLGGRQIAVEAVRYPELRQDPVVGPGFVRFTQTAGGRAGIHAPRHVRVAPFAKIQSPAVWTTLALTIHADGSAGRELVDASSFPRHWIYDGDGQLAGQSALIDFKTWYRTTTIAHSPRNGHHRTVPGGRPNRQRPEHNRLIETWGRRCGPGRDGSESGRSVERSRWAGSLTACRLVWPGLRTTCRPAGASPWRGSKEA